MVPACSRGRYYEYLRSWRLCPREWGYKDLHMPGDLVASRKRSDYDSRGGKPQRRREWDPVLAITKGFSRRMATSTQSGF